MIKASTFLLFSFLTLNSLIGQSSEDFTKNQARVSYEKIYIQTDRDFFFLGDTIWFKAYLLNCQSHSLVSDIQNLFIELIDSQGNIRQEQVLLCEFGQASGNLMIPDTSFTGPFVIRAYTHYLKNFGEEMFFP